MTHEQLLFYGGQAIDVAATGMALFLVVVARRFHQGPTRRRVAASALTAGLILVGAVVLRAVDGPILPVWYLPMYVMCAPVIAYAFIVHVRAIVARFRATRRQGLVLAGELERRVVVRDGQP